MILAQRVGSVGAIISQPPAPLRPLLARIGGASVNIVFIPSSRWCGRHRGVHFADDHFRVLEEVYLREYFHDNSSDLMAQ